MATARLILERGRWSVSAVARALRLSRPYLSSHRLPAEPRGDASKTEKHTPIVVRIKDLVARRGGYGYRRVTALLNRHTSGPRVNHRRAYRVMKDVGLVLPRYTGRVSRAHDGKVITPRAICVGAATASKSGGGTASACTSPLP